MCDVRTTLAWGRAVCSAWSSLEDNPRNRFLSRALLSSPAAVRMSCCTQIGEHQPDQPPRCRGLGWKLATLGGAVSAVGTMVLWWVARRRHSISSIVSVVSTRGGDTGASVTTVMSAQAVALLLFTWVQRGPKIVLSSCPECFMYISRCGL